MGWSRGVARAPWPAGSVPLGDGSPIPASVAASRVAWDVADVVRSLVGRSYGVAVVLTPAPAVDPALAEAVSRRLQDRGSATRIAWPGEGGEDVGTWADVVVDLGDGRLDGPDENVRHSRAAGIERARARGAVVVAAGLPTGVASSGAVMDGAVHAHTTLVWAAATRAVLLYPGRVHIGRLVVRDAAVVEAPAGWRSLTAAGASPGPYDMNTDKSDRGTVLAVAGSQENAGAASATGMAALSSGAGLVAVATPEPIHQVLSMQHPGLRVRPLTAHHGRIAESAIAEVAEELDRYQVVVAGPGLSPAPEVRRLVDLLRGRAERLVLDADALTVHEGDAGPLADHVGDLVLTPNAAELFRLGGRHQGGPLRHPGATAEQAPGLAERYDATIVAKGTRTVIAAPDGRVWVTPTGNPALSTGGSGDVLAGMVAAAIAGADDVPLAVARAAWWHGMVGDLAAERALGRASATDLLARMPQVFGRIGHLAEAEPLFPFTDQLSL